MNSPFVKIISLIALVWHMTSCAQTPGEKKNENTASSRQQLSAVEFNAKIQEFTDEQIIDVRTPEEFEGGYISGAENINFNDASFMSNMSKLDKNRPVMVYCLSGGRSSDAAEMLVEAGFTKVFDMKGGTMAWSKNGFAFERGQQEKTDRYTSTDYQQLLQSELPVLIDYYAPWCGPCKKMEPSLEKLKQEFAGKIRIERINVDEATALTKEMGIENIPVITGIQKGKETFRETGFQSEEQLRKLIAQLIN
jgi:thioredoxin 1